uniref:ribosomal protein S5 n=1 Tax=Trichophyton soudanense TaxID=69891 RepID=UPI001BF0EFDD|nr:ribosomal protein S5 [Trichophyton soudanense]YP_010951138.1 ribosomal protein S5 [Trichophyton violaceum]YP_010951153.1 ribosomal protein S5 [Trichophyton yaoundei]QUL58736.1 ribosomal protein S3 [Trichophyton kuryangei]WML69519.1 ribosomal protein S5 [Trichophyton soudanense]WML69534.1 ribosomal protein S5 [Trichophyton violaceum]WML69549.1 ribosomal protein S5 [Trichophyton yaoundei]
MLNIIKSKIKHSYKNISLNSKHKVLWPNKFIPIVRDWKNSIYTFNKNSLNNIIEANKLINKLIDGYFNLYNFKLEEKIRSSNAFKKNVNISKNKILISLGQFKHTNDLINITIYFYNRQLITYNSILKRYSNFLKQKNFLIKKNLRLIKKLSLKIIKRESELKNLLLKTIEDKNKLNNIKLNVYKDFLEKSLEKEFIYLYLIILIFINKSKFNSYYLHNLTNLIKKIYKKNIQFNFINLKYHYLNSDIFTKVLLLKLSAIKSKVLESLSSSIKKVKVIENRNVIDNSKYLKGIILDNIKYKRVSGVRLEASGRLTKRFTASRSLSKLKYKGSLINIKSSENFESSALIRGNFRPNLEYTKLNSTTRIGSYGIKGWVGGK